MRRETHRAGARALGVLIDRKRPLRFRFDGRDYGGFAGDTLASALLANGVRLVGRSFKYHRPRGILGAGVEEPNALVQLRRGARSEPNLRATQVELYDGLEAHSQNRWPSLAFDLAGVGNAVAGLLPAGFYNKTFMWPPSSWRCYEYFIRRAAGLGRAPGGADPDHYAQRFAHCDVLVIGAGAAGLSAALAAGRCGVRVILVDEQAAPGGWLSASREILDGRDAMTRVRECVAELAAMPNVRLLRRTTAFGFYDDNMVTACERVTDHLREPPSGKHDTEQNQDHPPVPRQRLWWIRAARVVLAAGALERHITFPGNDVPGVMLASAVQAYIRRYAVCAGREVTVFTNNDSAYAVVPLLHTAGARVAHVVDARPGGAGRAARRQVQRYGVPHTSGAVVSRALGYKSLVGIEFSPWSEDAAGGAAGATMSRGKTIHCDLLCVSGGWNPTAHLYSQAGGRLRYDERLCAFVPGSERPGLHCAGAVRGLDDTDACIADGAAIGVRAAQECGATVAFTPPSAPRTAAPGGEPPLPLWRVPNAPGCRAKAFVDFQNDVSDDDVALAFREGYRSVEHLKRYTTLGMGTDQGRTGNVIGLAIMAGLRGRTIAETGATTFRPPYSAVALGALASGEHGRHFAPLRRTPLHDLHETLGAAMLNVGPWQRAQYYAAPGETMHEAIRREALHVRQKVGLVDISTLGKIAVMGRDATAFLDRVYINRFSTLKTGRCRYGVMLREDGFVFDDGASACIADGVCYMTTTTTNAGPVMAHLEYYAQTVWPELQVRLESLTDQWAGMALAGPRAREVLQAAGDGDFSDEALPFMGCTDAVVGGCPVRLLRITFSGERAYEVHTPSDYAVTVWETLLEAGAPFEIAPYGTEAMNVLRIEKGHVTGAELDGTTLAADLGFAGMQKTDGDFIGKRSLERPAFADPARLMLAGLVACDRQAIPRGAQLIEGLRMRGVQPMLGHVTSSCYSSILDQQIALALLAGGREQHGRELTAASPLTGECVAVTVCSPHFFDPAGERARG